MISRNRNKDVNNFLELAEKYGREKYQLEIVPEFLSKIYEVEVENPEDFFQEKSKDPLNALLYILKWGFLRGRRDDLSLFYAECAKKAIFDILKGYTGKDKILFIIDNKQKLKNYYKEVVSTESKEKKEKEYNYNDRDVELLGSLLDHLKNISKHNYNVVQFLIEEIENSNIKEAYKWLIDVKQIGDKIAGCILRDIFWLYNYTKDKQLEGTQKKYLFPVDTWVRNMVKKLLENDNLTDKQIKKEVISYCDYNDLSFIRVNQGIWYIGIHQTDVLFDIIKNPSFILNL